MNVIFKVDGGLGKSVSSTAVVKRLREKYEGANIIVTTHHKDVFLNNPNVDFVYDIKDVKPWFYDKHVRNQECEFFIQEPYHANDFYKKNKSVIEIWFDMIGENYHGEMPELYFSDEEKRYYSKIMSFEKPLAVIQPHGGSPQSTKDAYNWARDMPPLLCNAIINYLKDNYTVGLIRSNNQLNYSNTITFNQNWRMVSILMQNASKRILIDSSFQHIAAAMNLKSAVLWSQTDPKVFGYERHINIKANTPTKKTESIESVLIEYGLEETIQNFPYDKQEDVFSIDKVVYALNKL